MESFGYETGKAKSGIARGGILVVSGFVSFVDDNEAEIVDGGEESRARANNNMWFGGGEKLFPDEMTFGFGLTGMNENNMTAEGRIEDGDELGSEGDFWDEKDSGLTTGKGVISQF